MIQKDKEITLKSQEMILVKIMKSLIKMIGKAKANGKTKQMIKITLQSMILKFVIQLKKAGDLIVIVSILALIMKILLLISVLGMMVITKVVCLHIQKMFQALEIVMQTIKKWMEICQKNQVKEASQKIQT
jgi:hypothetical protein